jgi:hypothetical protein
VTIFREKFSRIRVFGAPMGALCPNPWSNSSAQASAPNAV